jgi:hypothetical protein
MGYSLGMSWQSENIKSAASYMRERISAGDASPRTKAIYEGLLDVLDPNRRATRVQREMAIASKASAAAAIKAERERRAADRRRANDRRGVNLGSPTGVERREGDRRTSGDRRNR